MDLNKLIGGRQFWTIIAVLALLLGALLLLAKPQDKSEPVPTPAADDTQVLVLNYHMVNSMFISLAV